MKQIQGNKITKLALSAFLPMKPRIFKIFMTQLAFTALSVLFMVKLLPQREEMPHSPEGVWGKTVWSSSVVMISQCPHTDHCQNTVGTFLTLCSVWVRLPLENSAFF